jgi:lipopolysaccharide/colanic/teichoic acid biosynthesis glycosyltransferase
MKYRTNTALQAALVIADLLLLWTALFSSGNLPGPADWDFLPNGSLAQPMASDLALYVAVAGVWLAITLALGTYKAAANRMAYREVGDILKAVLMSAIALSGFLYLSGRDVALGHFWSFIALALLLLMVFRLATRVVFKLAFHRSWRTAMIAPSRVVVVGEGQLLYDTLCTLSNCDPKEVALLGFIDYQADLENAISEAAEHAGGSLAPERHAEREKKQAVEALTTRPLSTRPLTADVNLGASALPDGVVHAQPTTLAVIEPVHTRASAKAASRLAGGAVDHGRWKFDETSPGGPGVQIAEPAASPIEDQPASNGRGMASSPLGLAIEQLVVSRGVDNVVVAMSRKHHHLLARVVGELQRLPVHIVMIPDVADLTILNVGVTELGKSHALNLRAPILTGQQLAFKRVVDLLIVVLLMPLLLPVMALAALAIKLDSAGPVIFKQKRVGQYGKAFTIFKFRTMVSDAEKRLREVVTYNEDGKPLFKNEKGDHRITRVGQILRRLSVDELPQLFNVLRGQMSLVGPRPELPRYVGYYDTWQHFRLWMPPGITGWWQVNGREKQPMYLFWDDDLYYIRNYSLLLDLQILWLTLSSALFGGTGQ